jgi:hypothetical protein
MIKQAIEKVLDLAPIQRLTVGDNLYCKADQRVVRLQKPEQSPPEVCLFRTLTGLVDYIETNPDGLDMFGLFLHIADAGIVDLIGPLQPENDNTRFNYASARSDGLQFMFGHWWNVEDLIIALQTCFSRPDGIETDVDAIIQLIGNIASERVRNQEDDGFSQRVEIRSGLTTKSTVKVENPVRVRPWRTFFEVLQPESLAVLRFKERDNGLPQVGLFESASKSWRAEAIASVRDWLRDRLPTMKIFA